MLALDHAHTDLTVVVVFTMVILTWLWLWSSPQPYWVGHNHMLIFTNFMKMATYYLPWPSMEFLWEVHHNRGHFTTTVVRETLMSLKICPVNGGVYNINPHLLPLKHNFWVFQGKIALWENLWLWRSVEIATGVVSC